jgi:hypothetical protein
MGLRSRSPLGHLPAHKQTCLDIYVCTTRKTRRKMQGDKERWIGEEKTLVVSVEECTESD